MQLSLIEKETMQASIILQIRHGGEGDWVPMGTRNGRQYRGYINSWHDRQYQDGSWREVRNPTDAEIDVIDGSKQTVDFGEHANKTYEAVLTNKPQYVVYLTTEEDQGDQLESKKFTKWITRHQRAKS